ncbi:putative protocadherin Fat 4 [Apostichopus japonicus]|uniref:Putative protocadherin Fat 4 n=1 Tax=Stichopus japonicus TaxID=307972 RepID=A0A2G8JRF4_STIJA|nr:putative protocadherin Fat 4 [Apostichopus japonicus]
MEITVFVDDVNDNVPVFGSDSYWDTIPENVPVGLEFLRVTATDADAGSNAWVSYTIVDGNYNSDFAIDLESGVLSWQSPWTRERRHTYELTIRAQDSEDVNDNNPVFPDVYQPVVIENNLPEITVEQVAADDVDEGVNGALTYSLQGNTYNSLFTIERTSGVIKVKGRLDHEERKEYTLTVVAEDAGQFSLIILAPFVVAIDKQYCS